MGADKDREILDQAITEWAALPDRARENVLEFMEDRDAEGIGGFRQAIAVLIEAATRGDEEDGT